MRNSQFRRNTSGSSSQVTFFFQFLNFTIWVICSLRIYNRKDLSFCEFGSVEQSVVVGSVIVFRQTDSKYTESVE